MPRSQSQILSVLNVDDSESDQLLARTRILRASPSTEFHAARDGLEALEFLRTAPSRPDLILLDLNMPRMNGMEFLRVYEAEFDPAERSPVVVLTTSNQAIDRLRAEASPAVVAYLTKPLPADWQAVVDAIRKDET